MSETADVIVVGAGVQGTSLAFHLASRGAQVLVVESATTAAGATGRSSGFVRMHYDLESDARLAWTSFPYFQAWQERVGAGDCGFVRTGFLQLMPDALADAVRANVATQQGIGIVTRTVTPAEVAELVPGALTEGIGIGVYEAESGYADPSGTAAGFLEAARRLGARYLQGCRVSAVAIEGQRVVGVDSDRGRLAAPVVVDAAGAWAAALAATAGVDVPVQAWRHDTAFFGLPEGRTPDFPIVIDELHEVYFRPEGHDMMLVGLEGANEVGGSPDRPLDTARPATVEDMIKRVGCPGPVDERGHVPDRPRRPGRHHARPASAPGRGRARRVLPPVRVLRDGVQDRPGDRDLPRRAHPRRPRDDGRHRRLRAGPVRGGPAARRRASLRGPLALMGTIRILDVTDAATFGRIPPCADPGFDHRSCDYWEDDVRGSKAARLSWLEPGAGRAAASEPAGPSRRPANPFLADLEAAAPVANPFATARPANPFLTPGEEDDGPLDNPFAPRPVARPTVGPDAPRKLELLGRGLGVAGSYAKVLLEDDLARVYAQFGPLTAYPRAQRTRDLYPALPDAPLPAVITCIATTAEARSRGLARALVGGRLRRSGRAWVHRCRDVPRARRTPGRDERGHARVLGDGRVRARHR